MMTAMLARSPYSDSRGGRGRSGSPCRVGVISPRNPYRSRSGLARRITGITPPSATVIVRRMRATRGLLGALVVAVVLFVSGCGGSSSGESSASDRCEPLPTAAAEHLGSALDGKKLVDPVAVRSDDFEHVYFVAARVDGSPALWAMNSLECG